MNDNGEQSIMDKLLGLNWRTTIGGAMAAAGGVLAASAPAGRWQVAGQVIGAVGVAWLGLASRDRVVSGDQMQQAKDDKAIADNAKDDAKTIGKWPPLPPTGTVTP